MNNFDSPLFDPRQRPVTSRPRGEARYVYHDHRIALAVNVALATERPLFVTGSPGSGKSTLAIDVARRLGWAYISAMITSRTRLDDLVARYDAVQRLADAQARVPLKRDDQYLVPGVLWWAFAPESAAALPLASDDRQYAARARAGVVVLLDEMDKAEPDLPNDLLEPLGSNRIQPPHRTAIAAATPVLVIITSNGERRLPPAFLRRCVSLELRDQDPAFLKSVAESHFGRRQDSLYRDVAAATLSLIETAPTDGRRPPSVAEYLDTLRACIQFDERPGSDLWNSIVEVALRKTRADDEKAPVTTTQARSAAVQ